MDQCRHRELHRESQDDLERCAVLYVDRNYLVALLPISLFPPQRWRDRFYFRYCCLCRHLFVVCADGGMGLLMALLADYRDSRNKWMGLCRTYVRYPSSYALSGLSPNGDHRFYKSYLRTGIQRMATGVEGSSLPYRAVENLDGCDDQME